MLLSIEINHELMDIIKIYLEWDDITKREILWFILLEGMTIILLLLSH